MFLAATTAMLLVGCDGAADTAATTAATNAATPVVLAPGARDWTQTVVATPQGGFRMGNPGAPVKLVEFGSMTCHVCRDFSKDASAALENNYVKTGQVSYEFRNFVRDPYDIVVSLLARCGGAQPFFKLTEQLYTEQDEFVRKAQTMTPAQIKSMDALPAPQQFVQLAGVMELDKFVGIRGIPAAKAQACLTDQAATDRLVESTQAAGREYRIDGTPTFLINNEPVENAVQWATLEPKIKAALGS